ncbi:winged helix-turn-helix domain-containing protein [Corynebacterium sp. 335C]
MARNLTMIAADRPLLGWLADALAARVPRSAAAAELGGGLRDLADGRVASVLLVPEDGAAAPAEPDVIVADGVEIHPLSRRVIVDGREVRLTPKEYGILHLLAVNRGQVFTKEQIYRAVWEQDYLMDDSNTMAFIRKLRKKIEPAPDAPRRILTIWGIGYKYAD